MSKVNIQSAVEEYHYAMKKMGMDMHQFHADWHRCNPEPKPSSPGVHWGEKFQFGTDFLQMHHEMVKAKDSEPKSFMHHQSIVSWFRSKQYDLPSEWDPSTPIPPELSYHPTDPRLKRITDNPGFRLPGYFYVGGIGAGELPEPITGAEKLSDFTNSNQLGCCLVFPHNKWHIAIGGAMGSFETAIFDPIFYFGVHWEIDKIFDSYKGITERGTNQDREIEKHFSKEQFAMLKTAKELGLST